MYEPTWPERRGSHSSKSTVGLDFYGGDYLDLKCKLTFPMPKHHLDLLIDYSE